MQRTPLPCLPCMVGKHDGRGGMAGARNFPGKKFIALRSQDLGEFQQPRPEDEERGLGINLTIDACSSAPYFYPCIHEPDRSRVNSPFRGKVKKPRGGGQRTSHGFPSQKSLFPSNTRLCRAHVNPQAMVKQFLLCREADFPSFAADPSNVHRKRRALWSTLC